LAIMVGNRCRSIAVQAKLPAGWKMNKFFIIDQLINLLYIAYIFIVILHSCLDPANGLTFGQKSSKFFMGFIIKINPNARLHEN
jgi:hypothetical protein